MQKKNFQIRKTIPIKPRENSKPGSDLAQNGNRDLGASTPEKADYNAQRQNYESPVQSNPKMARKINEHNENNHSRQHIQSRPVAKIDQNQGNQENGSMPKSAPLNLNKRIIHKRSDSKTKEELSPKNNQPGSAEKKEREYLKIKRFASPQFEAVIPSLTRNKSDNQGSPDSLPKINSRDVSKPNSRGTQNETPLKSPKDGVPFEFTLANFVPGEAKQEVFDEPQNQQGNISRTEGHESRAEGEYQNGQMLGNGISAAGKPGQIRGVFMREHISQTELQKQQEQKRLMREMLDSQLNEKKRKKEEEKLKDMEQNRREEERIMKEIQYLSQQHEKEMSKEGKRPSKNPNTNISIKSIPGINEPEPKQPAPYITSSATKASINDLSNDNPMKIHRINSDTVVFPTSTPPITSIQIQSKGSPIIPISKEINQPKDVPLTKDMKKLYEENIALQSENKKKEELIDILITALKQKEVDPKVEPLIKKQDSATPVRPNNAELDSSRVRVKVPIPTAKLNLANGYDVQNVVDASGTPEFALRNMKVSTPNRNSQMKFFAPNDMHARQGEEANNNRVYSSPLTSTITRNEMYTVLEQNGMLPPINSSLFPRDKSNLSQQGLSALNNNMIKNMNNLKNFDALNGQSYMDSSHALRTEGMMRGLNGMEDKSTNMLRQSKSDIKILKGENIGMMGQYQFTGLKKQNFNETFNPAPALNTYNNYNFNKLNGPKPQEDVRQSMKFGTNNPQNILVVDEGQNRGAYGFQASALRESFSNFNQKVQPQQQQPSKGYSYHQPVTKVNIIDIAENHLIGSGNNNLELSFRNGEGAKALERIKSNPGTLDPKNSKFPKDVFSFNMKKKFAT